jgi:hypothetical protein
MLQVFARLYSLLLIVIISVSNVYAESLKNHSSPYLQLHANDPINWQTWGRDVLKQAKQKKLFESGQILIPMCQDSFA